MANTKMRTIDPLAGPDAAKEKFNDVVKNYDKAIAIRKEIGAPAVEILCKAALVYIEKPRFFGSLEVGGEDRQQDLKKGSGFRRTGRTGYGLAL